MVEVNITADYADKFGKKPYFPCVPDLRLRGPMTCIVNSPGNGGTHLLSHLYKSVKEDGRNPAACFSYPKISQCRKKIYPSDFYGLDYIFIDGFYMDEFSDEFLRKFFFASDRFYHKQMELIVQYSHAEEIEPLHDMLKYYGVNSHVIELNYPGPEATYHIARNCFQDEKIRLGPKVFEYFANMTLPSVRHLKNLISCIIATAKIRKTNLNNMPFDCFLNFASDILIAEALSLRYGDV